MRRIEPKHISCSDCPLEGDSNNCMECAYWCGVTVELDGYKIVCGLAKDKVQPVWRRMDTETTPKQ